MSILKKYFSSLIILAVACTNPNYTPPENALDAGRQFADAMYKGNFKRAADLIVPTEQNKNLLEKKIEEPYHQRPSADRGLLAQSSLQIIEIDNRTKEEVTFIHFLNAYDNRPAILKIVKDNGAWRVDLQYTFSGKL